MKYKGDQIMKYIIASFLFFMCSTMCLAATTDDVCAYAKRGVHTVSENPYRPLLARLIRNDNAQNQKKMNYKKKRKKKGKKKEWGIPGTGLK